MKSFFVFCTLLLFPVGCTFDRNIEGADSVSTEKARTFSPIEEMFIYSDYLFQSKKEEKKQKPIIAGYTEKSLKCLSDNIYHEARGEGTKGMRLVADVTLNRVLSSKYPNSICSVVYQKSQFSWTRKKGKSISEPSAYRKAKRIAREALYRTKDSSKGATYFYAHRVVTPSWAYHKTKTVVHKGHTFLR